MSNLLKQYEDDVWYMKFRPDKIEDLVLPSRIKSTILKQKESGKIMHMILSGPAGMGKTTIPMILAEELNIPTRYFNFSLTRSIDVIRKEFTDFAMGKSATSIFDKDDESKPKTKNKMIIGDEFDRLSPEAMDALKGVIEQCSSNCIFIFTTNHANKIIEPIRSRCMVIDFFYDEDEAKKAKKEFFMITGKKLIEEEVKFDKKALATLVSRNFPDLRKTWNVLQMISNTGNGITEESIKNNTFNGIDKLFGFIKDGDFGAAMEFLANVTADLKTIYSTLFKEITKYIKGDSLPEAIIILAEYQHKAAFAIDPLIDINACIVKLMTDCEWE